MRALLLKDWYMMRGYCRSYLLIIVVFAGVSLISSENLFFAAYPAVMAGVLPMTLVSYDERFHWPAYAGVLPLGRREEVREKYLLSFLLVLGAGTVMAFAQAIAACAREGRLPDGFALTLLSMFAFGLLGPCVLLPLVFRFGAEKARMYFYVFIIAVGVLAGISGGMAEKVDFSFSTAYFVVLAAVVAVFLPASYLFSCRSYEKREF